jgi:hypothetical protein
MNDGLQEELNSDRKAQLALIKNDMYVSEFFKLLLKVDKRNNPHLYNIINNDRHNQAPNTKRKSDTR